MPRTLTLNMNAAAINPHLRTPAWKIYVYDLLSTDDEMKDIVLGNELDATTGPRDFTNDLVNATLDEVAGDYIDGGIATSSLTLNLLDPNGYFNPDVYQLTGVGNGRWLREGNAVRLLYGDQRIDEDEWVWLFTGFLVGQAGVDRNRSNLSAAITCKALGRESVHVNQENTSDDFPDGTAHITIARDIAENDMGLDPGEISFGNYGATLTRHTSTQVVDESPLVSIAKVLFSDLRIPRFNGEGKLTTTSGSVTQSVVRVYSENAVIKSIVKPYHANKRINAVKVIGLDAGLTKAQAPTQELATLSGTTGWFTNDEKIYVYWAKDHTQLAEAAYVRVLQSVNSGLTPLGGGETFEDIPAPNPDQEGTIGMIVRIDTGFAPYLVVMMQVAYVALAIVPDIVIAFGEGYTISVGRLVQAILLVAIMLIISAIGKFNYQFIGDPFEYVFLEIRAEAREEGVTHATRNAREVENHFINTTTLLHSLAFELLKREIAKSAPRDMMALYDPRLEVDDTFENYDGRRYLVRQITTTFRRGDENTTQLKTAEITDGIRA